MNDYDLVIFLDDLVVFNDLTTRPKKLNINTPLKNPNTNGKSLYHFFHINNY